MNPSINHDKQVIEMSCPACGGPVSQIDIDGSIREYECLVGHRYSSLTLLSGHSDTQERALWAAVVALEESKVMVRSIAKDISPNALKRLEEQADEKHGLAQEIRSILTRLKPFHLDP